MGPRYDDAERQAEPTAITEPLVDINVHPAQASDPQPGVRPRRKRLSDMEAEDSETQPQPQANPPRRRLLETNESRSDEAVPPPGPSAEPRRPRLVNIEEAPEGQDLRLRPGRPRLVLAQTCDGMPGLQNIIDPPGSVNDLQVSGPATAAQSGADARAGQSFSVAAVGGLAAAAVGAMVWALLAAATNHALSWMALVVGLLVGGTVRVLGRGTDKSLGYLGVATTVLGCLLGHLLSICTTIAGQEGLSSLNVVMHICSNPAVIPGAMIATFHSMDLLFYGIAIYGGYRLSFRRT